MEDKYTKEKNLNNPNLDKSDINEINIDNNNQIIKEDLDIITSHPSKNKNNNSEKFESNLKSVF